MRFQALMAKSILCVSVAVLTASNFAYAQTNTSDPQDAKAFQSRLVQLYSDKNRPFPKDSTANAGKEFAQKKSYSNKASGARAMGGISDGGGNLVGQQLFDFYEDKGSLPLTVDELLSLEPLAQQKIAQLNQMIPAVRSLDGAAFGAVLKKSLSAKKILLETKPISSQECVNQSMVSTDAQTIGACQDDRQVRFTLRAMKTNALTRAGLIVHEMVLAWLRSKDSKLAKEDLEQRVREVVRAIFSQNVNALDLAKALSEADPDQYDLFFDSQNFVAMKQMKAQYIQAYASFCQNPTTALNLPSDEQLRNPLADREIITNTMKLRQLSNDSRNGTVSNAATLEYDRANFCAYYRIDQTPIHVPIAGSLNDQCRNQMDLIIALASDLSNPKYESTYLVLSSANSMCKNSDEAINYFRYSLLQKGIQYRFLDN